MKKYELTQEQIEKLAEKKHAKELLKEFLPEAFENKVEEWLPVLNYKGFYEVSNFGHIRSLSREVKHSKNPLFTRKVASRILLPTINNKGYYKVRLSKEGIKNTHLIHHLVAESFLNHTVRNSKICIDHMNENKLDNRAENLQIITKKENTKKSFDFKLDKFTVGDFWFHSTGTLNLIIEVTKLHGGTLKCKPIHSDNYSFHGIGVMDRLATEEEVREALINEAKKRGFNNIGNLKIKNTFGGISNGFVTITNDFYYDYKGNTLRLDGAVIFNNGVWAEIIEEKNTFDKDYLDNKITEIYSLLGDIKQYVKQLENEN